MIRAQDRNLAIAATNANHDDDASALERIVNTDIKLGSNTQTARRSISSRPGATARRRVSEVSAESIESALSAFSKTARSIYDEDEMDLVAMLKDLRV